VQVWHANTHYDATPGKTLPSQTTFHDTCLRSIATGAACNSTCELLFNVETPSRNGDSKNHVKQPASTEPVVNGNATEGALLLYLRSLNQDYTAIRKKELNVNRGLNAVIQFRLGNLAVMIRADFRRR
jgi:hypothetical protein